MVIGGSPWSIQNFWMWSTCVFLGHWKNKIVKSCEILLKQWQMNRNDVSIFQDSGIREDLPYCRIYPNFMVISMGLRSRWSSGYGQLLLGGPDGLLPVGWKGRDVGSWGKNWVSFGGNSSGETESWWNLMKLQKNPDSQWEWLIYSSGPDIFRVECCFKILLVVL